MRVGNFQVHPRQLTDDLLINSSSCMSLLCVSSAEAARRSQRPGVY